MKKKIIISALALTIGAGLAGSITGTAAWYQYSTKVNGAYIGASGGASGNLNMRIRKNGLGPNDEWTTFLSKETLGNYVRSQGFGTNILPVTPGALTKDSDLAFDSNDNPVMYSNPVPGKAAYENWNKASKANYVVIPLQLRYTKESGSGKANIATPVYLSDLTLEQRTVGGSTSDISDALRFHVSSYTTSPTQRASRLVSKKGGTTVTNGQLDLDGDGNPDVARAGDKYGFSQNGASSTTPITYGEGVQVSYTAEKANAPIENRQYYDETNTLTADGNVYSLVPETREGDNGAEDLVDSTLDYNTDLTKAIGTTVAGTSNFLNVDITIWVEGWQKFPLTSGGSSYSSIWNDSFIGSDFNIGFEFAVNAEIDPVI